MSTKANQRRRRVLRLPVIVTGAFLLLCAAGGVAFTASIASSNGQIATGSAATGACDTDGVSVDSPSPLSFSVGSAPGTNVIQYNLTGVNAACNGKKFKAVLANSNATPVCIAQGSGTLTVTSGAASVLLSSNGCTIPTGTSGSSFDAATSGVGQLAVTFYD